MTLDLEVIAKAILEGEQFPIQGPDGPPGSRGERGEQGLPGFDGVDGPPGPPGQKGDPGKDGEDGEDGKDGKKGDRGLRGEKGDRGDRGPQGKDGQPGPRGMAGPRGTGGNLGGGSSGGSQTAIQVPFTPAGTIAATNVQAAIEEVAAEAGSGTTDRELILNPGISTTVSGDGNTYPLPWTKLSGSDLLDLSDPLAPTVVEAGIYALNVNVICTEDVLDLYAQMFFGLDVADGDAYQDSHVPLRSATGNPRVSHSITYYLEAGSEVGVRVAQNTGGDLLFFLDAMIQRIS